MSPSSYPVFLRLTGTWWLSSLLLFGLSLFSCMMVFAEVEGGPRVICSSQPIVIAVDDDVILPCHVEPQLSVENLTVQWWKPDIRLDPDDPLSDYRYVHSYHENHDEEDRKMSWYKGRTALNRDGLEHGNVSLKIMNVRLSDRGSYRCQIPQWASASFIKLVVVKSGTTETPHPTVHHQTPDPNDGTDVKGEETDVKGGQLRLDVLILVLGLIPVLVLGLVGLAAYFLRPEDS